MFSFWQNCQWPAGLAVLGSTLLLGLRHGLDMDHLAAITDMTAARASRSEGLLLAALYALGHAIVVLMLGWLAIEAGFTLPSWLDNFMEPLVGITLIALSLWLIYTLVAQREHFRFTSRFGLIFEAGRSLSRKLRGASAGQLAIADDSSSSLHRHLSGEKWGLLSCLGIGAVHGIGAETPTQILTLCAVGALRGQILGGMMLFSFVGGIFISNMLVAALALSGYKNACRQKTIGICLCMLTAIFSLLVGATFLLKHAVPGGHA